MKMKCRVRMVRKRGGGGSCKGRAEKCGISPEAFPRSATIDLSLRRINAFKAHFLTSAALPCSAYAPSPLPPPWAMNGREQSDFNAAVPALRSKMFHYYNYKIRKK
ncbi:hypothetical protein KSP39_PZI021972 [Platanthera zijinensis]|uniref:Uncharacterized protein n=1 Tax=Platanthera zijinensis TaxID=2320716 RepID=A0AAP0FWK8_9ASPA